MTKNEMLSDVNKAIFVCEIALMTEEARIAETKLKMSSLRTMRERIEVEISKDKIRQSDNA